MLLLRARLGRVLAPVWLWLLAGTALAHPAPGSAVLLDVQRQSITAELRIPLTELQLAFGKPLATSPVSAVAREAEPLRAYLARHVRVTAPDGRPWTVRVGSLQADVTGDPANLVARSQWIPPDNAPLRRFKLEYDAVAHQVPNHTALISLRRDWQSGALGEAPRLLATVRFNQHTVLIDLGPGSAWRGLASVLRLGMQHIAEGTDHLLFLLVLLLPAPLSVTAGRWAGYRGAGPSALQLLKIVTAFTVGHSLTLTIAGLDLLRLPGSPVEVAIALSILVSAVHAWRPVFAGRESFVAGGFGLVHGLAFAGVVAGLGLQGGQLVQAILGFNLGIEVMQLVVVALVFPLFIAMARTPYYAAVRVPLAGLAGAAALGWSLERLSGEPNAATRIVQTVADRPLQLLVSLAGLAALLGVAHAWQRRRRLKPPSGLLGF